jgi:hypothetical protein
MNAMFAQFRSFASLFAKGQTVSVPLYLTLLRLSDDATEALRNIRSAIRASPRLQDEVSALFENPNWRPQLVGGVALLLGAATPTTLDALWRAVDAGSWASPQLVAVASTIDTQFVSHARDRIVARCPIFGERLTRMPWPERHSAAGPESIMQHSAKLFAALVGLVELNQERPDWLTQELAKSDAQALLGTDQGSSRSLAPKWRSAWSKLQS